MKFGNYLKDRILFIIIFIAAFASALIFMTAFHVQHELIIAIMLIFLGACTITILLDYWQKKQFYDNIFSQLDSLDKKYLIMEMIEKPSFYEGRLFCEILEETGKSMCENVSEYRRKSADFREFIELWVHEIKLPLASLLLMVHNNKDKYDSKFSEQLRRIDGFTDTVLYYSRIDNAEKDYIIKDVSLKKEFSNTMLRYREDIMLHNVNTDVNIAEVKVTTDGKWLEYIIGQLISNSMKYFSDKRDAEISVFSEETDNMIIFHFKDNGIGIPANDIPYVFEKSFTGENGRIHAKSTGMGLYICKKLCDKLGHKIECKSVYGEYTEFLIYFPKNDFYKM